MVNKELTKAVITIEAVGKFGPKANGKWYGVKKSINLSEFEKGASYEVELEEWKEGRFNIVSFNKVGESASPEVKKEAKKQQKDVAVKEQVQGRSQLIGGRSHDAAQLVYTALVTDTPLKKVLDDYKLALNKLLEIAEDVK